MRTWMGKGRESNKGPAKYPALLRYNTRRLLFACFFLNKLNEQKLSLLNKTANLLLNTLKNKTCIKYLVYWYYHFNFQFQTGTRKWIGTIHFDISLNYFNLPILFVFHSNLASEPAGYFSVSTLKILPSNRNQSQLIWSEFRTFD